jgi:hypothetical protein
MSATSLREPRLLARFAARLLGSASLLALVVAGCDCDPEPIDQFTCDSSVETPDGDLLVEFPDTEVGGERARTVRLTNSGNTSLETFSFEIDGPNAGNYELAGTDDFRVEVNDNATFQVLFKPIAESTNLGATFRITHPPARGAPCPAYTVTVDGASFERIEFDAGPDAGTDAGPPPEDGGPDGGVLFDAGVVTPPDAGVVLPPGARFYARGAFQEARAGFAAIPLDDATILAIGGYGEDGTALDTIERFDPRKGISRIVGRMAVTRGEPGAALLDDGRVAIVGGRSSAVNGVPLRSVEVFDPTTGQVACPPPQGTCSLADNDSGVLTAGRIDPMVVAPPPSGSPELAVLLGRTLCDVVPDPLLPGCDEADDTEVPLPAGELITLGGSATAGALTGADILPALNDELRVIRDDGSALIAGGRTVAGIALSAMYVFQPATTQVTTLIPTNRALTARAGATGLVLENGDVLVVGGVDTAQQGVLNMERVIDPFNDDGGIDPDTAEMAGVSLETRFKPSFVRLPGDLLLLAGGAGRDPAGLDAALSVVPRRDAHLFVTLPGGDLLRVSPDNDLAVPRYLHQAVAVTIPDEGDAGAGDEDVVVFLGGSAVFPRRVPHPQAERFRLPQNAFEVYGLNGPGAAFAANAPATLYSLGGIDPHSGAVSSRVRAFDTLEDVFEDMWPLDEPRSDHSATLLLAGNMNTFLIAGGRDEAGQVLKSASLYNPFNDFAEPLPVTLNRARAGHTATALPDGTVLLCGGQGSGGEALDTCEVFTPPTTLLNPMTYDTASFGLTEGRMSAGRIGHTATILPDTNEVLLVGGGDVETDIVNADLYDVTDGVVRPTGLPVRARRQHAAAFLGGGRVLIAGGETYSGGLTPTADAEVYERSNGIFTPLADEMSTARVGAAAIPLVGGDVLIVGGERTGSGAFPTRSVKPSELYMPGATGIGEFSDSIDVPLTFGRSDLAGSGEVFGRGVAAGGNRRDGNLLSGDERHSPLYFVDKLVNPDEVDGGPGDGGS